MSGSAGSSRPDRWDQLYEISRHYAEKFPEGDTPLGYLSRLTEELGEIAVEVQRLEGAPAKVAKHGPGRLPDLASEVEDLIHTALGLIQHYRAEAELDEVVATQHRRISAVDRHGSRS